MSEAMTKSKYWRVFAALMVLLALTVFIAYMHINPWLAIIAAMTIAVIKAVLVILYFMHVKYNSRLTWLFVGSGFVWLGLMVLFTLTDYKSRDWTPAAYGAKTEVYSSPSQIPASMFPQNIPGANASEHGEQSADSGSAGSSPQ
jgi:cytochrome c oxidase subunit 4